MAGCENVELLETYLQTTNSAKVLDVFTEKRPLGLHPRPIERPEEKEHFGKWRLAPA